MLDKKEEIIISLISKLSISKNDQIIIYKFMVENLDQFYEISEKTVLEVLKIKNNCPANWKEMVAMTMFSTL